MGQSGQKAPWRVCKIAVAIFALDSTTPQTMKHRKFTDWLCDPSDERIIEVKSPRTGITYRSEVVKTEDGLRFNPIPHRPVIVVGVDADLTEKQRYQDYLSMPER
jgi:hypothetical protein